MCFLSQLLRQESQLTSFALALLRTTRTGCGGTRWWWRSRWGNTSPMLATSSSTSVSKSLQFTVRKHVTNAHNDQKQFKFTHFRIKIPLLHTYEHKAHEIKSGASRFRTREGGQRDPDGQQRHAQKWVKTSNYLGQICPKSFWKLGLKPHKIIFWTFSPKPCNKYELMKSKKLVTSITHKLVGTSFYLWLLPPKLCKNGSTPRFWQLSPKSGWNLGHLRLNFAFHFSSESAKASGVHFAKMKMQERCGEGGKQPTKEAAKWKRRKNLKKKN